MLEYLKKEDLLSAEQHAAFDKQYGDLGWALVRQKHPNKPGLWLYEIAFKKPDRDDYLAWKAAIQNPVTSGLATMRLLESCLLHPAEEKFAAIIKEYPGIDVGVQDSLMKMLGMRGEEVEK